MVNWCCRYYQHQETGFYYLQSRYYDPVICRFINTDCFVTTNILDLLGSNMFAYCENNPVNNSDPIGYAGIGLMSDWNPQEYFGPKPDNSLCPQTTVDITDKLNATMVADAEELSQIYETFGFCAAAIYFADKSKPGGDWDFKSQPSWNLNENTTYIYNGIPLQYDCIGNIHYGFVGRVLFSNTTLQIAGGAVQIYTGTSKLWFYSTWFDDPYDNEMINYGYHLWEVN